MSKKTLALIVGLITLTVILLIVALSPSFAPYLPEKPSVTPEQPTVTPTPPAHTTISISPNPYTLNTTTGTLDFVIDTLSNELTAVQLEISYDPETITNVQVSPGSFFPNPVTLLELVDNNNGRITYALGITPAQTPVKGQGIVARISFQRAPGVPAQQTQIELLPKTKVTQQGIGSSVLRSTSGTTIIIPEAPQLPQVIEASPQVTLPPQ